MGEVRCVVTPTLCEAWSGQGDDYDSNTGALPACARTVWGGGQGEVTCRPGYRCRALCLDAATRHMLEAGASSTQGRPTLSHNGPAGQHTTATGGWYCASRSSVAIRSANSAGVRAGSRC